MIFNTWAVNEKTQEREIDIIRSSWHNVINVEFTDDGELYIVTNRPYGNNDSDEPEFSILFDIMETSQIKGTLRAVRVKTVNLVED